MANDLNQCNFIGRCGKDPEVKYTPSGMAVANLSMAVGYKYKETEHTEWVRVVAFSNLAEIMGQYLTKGKQIFISGRMQTRSWEDQNGVKRYTTEIVAGQMLMLGSKSERSQNDYQKPSAPEPDDDGDIPFS